MKMHPKGPKSEGDLTPLEKENLKAVRESHEDIVSGINKLLQGLGVNLAVAQVVLHPLPDVAAKRVSSNGGCCCPDGTIRVPCDNCPPIEGWPSPD